jgi:transposase InsO family protein
MLMTCGFNLHDGGLGSEYSHSAMVQPGALRSGMWWDNAQAESFWATIKVEFYDRYLWPTQAAAKLAVGERIERVYNRGAEPLSPRYDQPGRL